MRAEGPRGRGAGLWPTRGGSGQGERAECPRGAFAPALGAPNPRSLPMQAAPLVASDVFTMSILSIGVRSITGVALGF